MAKNGCWNCKNFLNEDIDGIGWCDNRDKSIYCSCGGDCPFWVKSDEQNF